MEVSLRILAHILKSAAIVFSLVSGAVIVGFDILQMTAPHAPRDSPNDWGTAAYYIRTSLQIALMLVVASIAIAPNRRFVRSPLLFGAAFSFSLVPFGFLLAMEIRDLLATNPPGDFWFGWALLLSSALLPISLGWSFWRYCRRAKLGYA